MESIPSGGIPTKGKSAAVALFVLLALGVALFGYHSLSLELEITKAELSRSEAANALLRVDLNESQSEIVELTEARAELQKESRAQRDELLAAQSERVALKNEIDDLKQKTSQLESELVQINTSLARAREDISVLSYSDFRSTHLLAVGEVNIALLIEVEARNGAGLHIDMEGVLLDETVQESMKTAFDVAQDVTGNKLTGRMIIFHTRNPFAEDELIIDGGSAAAAMTIALIALAEGRKVKSDVFITGTIEPDGSIGGVKKVAEKARVARDAKAEIMLVPVGQGVRVSGIRIIEVANIRDAMPYMLE